ncbi:hypothetical protein AB0M42_10940 [Streptomyces sp. NPDC051784]|uniref:hypothetical protein n=1 Tax=Streptomyces sp. NPDC051784 TaxID=3155805 RepID=UPI0034400E06
MNPATASMATGPSDLALPLVLVTELAAAATEAGAAPRPPEVRSGNSRPRRAARRRAAAVRG